MGLPLLLLAQVLLVSQTEPLPKDQPTAKTERRVKLNTTPEALFAALSSKDQTRITEAATALGWEWLAERIYGDIALHAVNLDADDATERILTLENAAAVLKQEGADWWLVASFSCCGPSGRAAEPFVEWKSLVWPDTRDLIIHPGGQTNYQVYRLLRGHLYLVFEIDENPYNWRETIDTKVLPLSPGKLATLRTRGKATTCTNWNWNPAKYLFEHTSPKPAKCPSQ
jgi:hypothetical protein